ncbi:MAG: ABC transporter ATP-binding protein [Solirubrobacteraceae bacterium]
MLRVEGLDGFYGASQVLEGVSLTVGSGEVVVVLGRNGAGKTTTMASLLGFVRSRAERLELAGRDIARLAPFKRVRAGLGYVPQGGRVFAGLTVRENLDIVRGRSAVNGEAWTARRAFEAFPKLRELAARDAGLLSGGERQMLAVARALMANPSIVVLDEPSEGLSPVAVQALGELVGRLRDQGVGVLLAEQNPRFALQLADRGYFIEKGRIQHEGTAAELGGDEVLDRYLGV